MTDCERNADVSKTLTEQWKSGELKQGWYYINSGDIDYKYSKYNPADFFVTPHEDIKKVLAPVPSYEEWQAKDKENQQLKELLKECKRYIDFWGYTDSHGNFLYPQIDNAIGEKK